MFYETIILSPFSKTDKERESLSSSSSGSYTSDSSDSSSEDGKQTQASDQLDNKTGEQSKKDVTGVGDISLLHVLQSTVLSFVLSVGGHKLDQKLFMYLFKIIHKKVKSYTDTWYQV